MGVVRDVAGGDGEQLPWRPREQVAVSEGPVLRDHDAAVAVGALSYLAVGRAISHPGAQTRSSQNGRTVIATTPPPSVVAVLATATRSTIMF
jgi:hypothetical protein